MPEPGSIGALEMTVLLERAGELLGGLDSLLPKLASQSGLPLDVVQRVAEAAAQSVERPAIKL